MLRSIGKQSGEFVEFSPEEEKVGYSGKDLQKRKVLSLEWKSEGAMDDESGDRVHGTGGGSATERTDWCKSAEISAWLTKGSRKLVPETRGSILEGTICYS